MKTLRLPLLLALLLLLPGLLTAQNTFSTGWSTITGGGGLRTGTGEFTVSSAIGQFNASSAAGTAGEFSLTNGFWTLPPGPGANADLSALIISAGALSPPFAPATIAYTTTVNTDTSSLTVSPFAADAGATLRVRINGSGYVSIPSGGTTAPLPLNTGSNQIEILVTASNGTTTKLYTLTATRTPPGVPGELDSLNAAVSGFTVNATVVDPEGRILLAGSFGSVLGTPRSHIARLLTDGTLDQGFNPQAGADVTSVAVQPDGKILLGGTFTTVGGQSRSRLARVNNDGSLDTAFNPAPDNFVLTVVPDGNGKILLGGGFTTVHGQSRAYLARLNADGTLDSAFAPAIGGVVNCLAVQPDGKILVGGAFTTAGGQTRNRIARLNASGTLDTGFDPNADNQIGSLNVLPDGRILIGGFFSTMSGQSRPWLARVLTTGTLDNTFQPGPSNFVTAAAVQSDGKILISGAFTTVGGQTRNRVARLHSDGTLDTGFAPDANGNVFSVALQGNGQVLLGGEFFTVNGAIRNRFARINNDTAVRQLTVPDAARILWTRGGSAPDFTQVTFERSNGSSWTLLGQGTRVGTTSNWQLTGLSLTGTAGTIRARGRTGSGYLSAGGSLIEQQQPYNFLTGFALWAYNNIPSGRDATFTGDWNGDGVSNGLAYVFGNARITFAAAGQIPAPAAVPADVDLYLERSTTLAAAGWTPIASWVNAAAPTFAAGVTLVSGTVRDTFPGRRALYRYRAVARHLPYLNDFSATPAATLLGSAVWVNQSLRLTDALESQLGAAVLEGVVVDAGQTGFEALFSVAMGPTTSGTPADGMSFTVGDTGTAAWGENGPGTPHSLTIVLDTYDNLVGQSQAIGIRINVNGAMVAYHPANPYTGGATVPVEVHYTAATGVTVRFNGAAIFTNVAVPAFTLQAGDRYGFGGRTGGANEVNIVDNVSISRR